MPTKVYKSGRGPAIRQLDLDERLDAIFPAEREIHLFAVLGPEIVQGEGFPGRVLEVVYMLQQAHGTGVLQAEAFTSLHVAAVIEVHLRFFEDGPGDIDVERPNQEDDTEALQYVHVLTDRVGGNLEVPGDGGIRERRPNALPEHLQEQPDGLDLLDPAEFQDIFPHQVGVVLVAPAQRLGLGPGEERLGEPSEEIELRQGLLR